MLCGTSLSCCRRCSERSGQTVQDASEIPPFQKRDVAEAEIGPSCPAVLPSIRHCGRPAAIIYQCYVCWLILSLYRASASGCNYSITTVILNEMKMNRKAAVWQRHRISRKGRKNPCYLFTSPSCIFRSQYQSNLNAINRLDPFDRAMGYEKHPG